MTSIAVSQALPLVIQAERYARNGLAPSVELYQAVTANLNHCVLYRRKQFFSYGGRRTQQTAPIFLTTGVGATVTRWRARNHVGHGARALRFVVDLGLDTAARAQHSRVRFSVTPAGGSVGYTEYMHFGHHAGAVLDTPLEIATLATTYAVTANTTYEIAMLCYDGARPVSCLVFEYGADPDDTVNHYTTPGYAVNAPIVGSHRGDILAAYTALWKANASPIWQWSVDLAPITATSATYTNAIDGSSTTNSAASPGVTVDLTYRNTYARTTVPAVFAVYASSTGTGGKVKLLDGSGTVAEITGIGAAGWYSTTVNITAGAHKLDLMLGDDGSHTTSLYAMSLYEYEAA